MGGRVMIEGLQSNEAYNFAIAGETLSSSWYVPA
jgi:hypothetical protein